MNPLRVKAANLGPFPTFDVEIPAGTVAIVGANGAGKSMLLNSIDLALFARDNAELTDWLGPYGDRGELELVFEHGNELYRVRRSFGKKATLDFDRNALRDEQDEKSERPDSWVPLTRETVKATQAAIEQIIGLSRRTFRASAFLAQGDSAAFPLAARADRKAIVGEAIDPTGLWPRWAARAREEAKRAEGETMRLTGQIGIRNDQIAVLPEVRQASAAAAQAKERCAANLAEAERRLEQALAEQAANAAAAERVRTATVAYKGAETEHARAVDALNAARAAANELPGALEHLGGLQEHASRVPELETRLDIQRRLLIEAQALQERAATTASKIAALERARDGDLAETKRLWDEEQQVLRRRAQLASAQADAEHCHVCHQTLGEEARKASIGELDAQAKALNLAGEKAQHQLGVSQLELDDANALAESLPPAPVMEVVDLETPLRRARDAAGGIPQAEQNIRALEQQTSEIPTLEVAVDEAGSDLAAADRALAQAGAEVKDEAELRERVDATRRTVTTCRSELDFANTDAAQLAQRLEQLDQASREVVALNTELDGWQEQLDILRVGQKAFGRDGVPTLIAENIIPTLEASANQVLERMPLATGSTLRVELHTQVEQKDGRLAEALDIVVHDRDGTRRFETFSGGERFRVSFALRWALATLLANRRGAESKLLAVDEPDGLDATGMDGLVNVVTAPGVPFSKILVVSHQERLASSFDRTVEVQTDGDRSWIADSRPRVAA